DFKYGGVDDLAIDRLTAGFDRGVTRNSEILLGDGLAEAFTQHLTERFATHITPEALLDDLARHLAATESLELHGAAHFVDARAHLRFVLLGGNADGKTTLQLARVLD